MATKTTPSNMPSPAKMRPSAPQGKMSLAGMIQHFETPGLAPAEAAGQALAWASGQKPSAGGK